MIHTLTEITMSMSAVILLMLILTPVMKKRYSAKLRYYIWLVIALRLCLPFNITLPKAPVMLNVPENRSIIIENGGISLGTETNTVRFEEMQRETGIPQRHFPLKSIIFTLWAVGASLFFLFHMYGYFSFKRKIRPYLEDCDGTLLIKTAGELGIRNIPKLKKCGKISSPMMTGFFRHIILLPDREYSVEEMSGILKHELIHLKRGDIWYKLILVIAGSIHFFNPLVHIMIKAASRDIEYSCDDAVVKNKDIVFRKNYSMAILKSMSTEDTGFSMNLGESDKNKKQRFANILNTKAKKNGAVFFIIILLTAVVCGAIFSFGTDKTKNNSSKTIDYDYNVVIERLKNTDVKNLNGDFIVQEQGTVINKERFDNFLLNVDKGLSDEVIIVQYTDEGAPVLINVFCDGNKFYGVYDVSRDKLKGDAEDYFKFEYNYLKEFETGQSKMFYLVNDENITYDDIMKGMLSSSSTDFIPHQFLLSCETSLSKK